jgi:predicted RNase H-like nuclease
MRFIGVDLAWTTSGGTGLCAIAEGRVIDSTRVSTDDEIIGWLEPHLLAGCVVAIDAPLIVRNPTGRRRCDQLISQCFGAQHASTHSANLGLDSFRNGVRGERIVGALSLDLDPEFAPGTHVRRAIEVYPHPAIVALFGLSVTLKYKAKPGRTLDSRVTEMQALLGHLIELVAGDPPVDVQAAPRWPMLEGTVATPASAAELSRMEDEIDAFVCAYIALYYWTYGTDRCRVAGDIDGGYIVTPVDDKHAACLDRLAAHPVPTAIPLAVMSPKPELRQPPAGALARNVVQVCAAAPDLVETAATSHLVELRAEGEDGIVVIVTADAIELRLPTAEWTGGTHAPVEGSRFWRRLAAPDVEPETLVDELTAARAARRAEFTRCRYCGEMVPVEHRTSTDVCHACASEHEGVVF